MSEQRLNPFRDAVMELRRGVDEDVIPSLGEVARALGFEYNAFYDRWRGRTTASPEEVRALQGVRLRLEPGDPGARGWEARRWVVVKKTLS